MVKVEINEMEIGEIKEACRGRFQLQRRKNGYKVYSALGQLRIGENPSFKTFQELFSSSSYRVASEVFRAMIIAHGEGERDQRNGVVSNG